ncbi:MAG: hypothetical protein IPP88_11565 [Betaproteobacteria bacterium]|nr:hypothetical protein [Betaproteobacteria bacterium]
MSEEQIEDVKRKTSNGEKFEPMYSIDVVDTAGKVIARVEKTLYIRRKQEKPRAVA